MISDLQVVTNFKAAVGNIWLSVAICFWIENCLLLIFVFQPKKVTACSLKYDFILFISIFSLNVKIKRFYFYYFIHWTFKAPLYLPLERKRSCQPVIISSHPNQLWKISRHFVLVSIFAVLYWVAKPRVKYHRSKTLYFILSIKYQIWMVVFVPRRAAFLLSVWTNKCLLAEGNKATTLKKRNILLARLGQTGKGIFKYNVRDG